jgi:phage shock protein PspC (stress-responsive transcriptional regulator)
MNMHRGCKEQREDPMQDAHATGFGAETSGSSEPDSLFGVCQSIGEDLGFNPFLLRVALLGLLFFSPAAVIAIYLILAVTVALSRWLFPKMDSDDSREPQHAARAETEAVERHRELIAA